MRRLEAGVRTLASALLLGPASRSRICRSDDKAEERRDASTQPAVPPPMMMMSCWLDVDGIRNWDAVGLGIIIGRVVLVSNQFVLWEEDLSHSARF